MRGRVAQLSRYDLDREFLGELGFAARLQRVEESGSGPRPARSTILLNVLRQFTLCQSPAGSVHSPESGEKVAFDRCLDDRLIQGSSEPSREFLSQGHRSQ